MTDDRDNKRARWRGEKQMQRARSRLGKRRIVFFVDEVYARKFVTDHGFCTLAEAADWQIVQEAFGGEVDRMLKKHVRADIKSLGRLDVGGQKVLEATAAGRKNAEGIHRFADTHRIDQGRSQGRRRA